MRRGISESGPGDGVGVDSVGTGVRISGIGIQAVTDGHLGNRAIQRRHSESAADSNLIPAGHGGPPCPGHAAHTTPRAPGRPTNSHSRRRGAAAPPSWTFRCGPTGSRRRGSASGRSWWPTASAPSSEQPSHQLGARHARWRGPSTVSSVTITVDYGRVGISFCAAHAVARTPACVEAGLCPTMSAIMSDCSSVAHDTQ